jgi:hypothetical protein
LAAVDPAGAVEIVLPTLEISAVVDRVDEVAEAAEVLAAVDRAALAGIVLLTPEVSVEVAPEVSAAAGRADLVVAALEDSAVEAVRAVLAVAVALVVLAVVDRATLVRVGRTEAAPQQTPQAHLEMPPVSTGREVVVCLA